MKQSWIYRLPRLLWVMVLVAIFGGGMTHGVLSASPFEEYVARMVSADDDNQMKSPTISVFGKQIFNVSPSDNAFSRVVTVPVGSDYVVGVGDQFNITIWGNIDATANVTVDSDGNITLPKIGVVNVQAQPFDVMQRTVKAAVGRLYKGFDINISLSQLRSNQVYVVGDAANPGTYTVSPLASLLNVVLACGGPSESGSLRNIQLRRNGQTITRFDAYRLLIDGEKTGDVRLMSGDIIYFPPSLPQVGVVGSVKRPGVYEVYPGGTIGDVIRLAGGLSDIAFQGRIQLFSITNNTQLASELDVKSSLNLPVGGGEIVKVFDVSNPIRMVTLTGAVTRPGRYAHTSDLTVEKYLSLAGGPTFLFGGEVEVSRLVPSINGPIETQFKVATNDLGRCRVEPGDRLFFTPFPEWNEISQVTVNGEVRLPGQYAVRKGETLSSVISRAGGLTNRSFLKGMVLTRESVKQIQKQRLTEIALRLREQSVAVPTGSEGFARLSKLADEISSSSVTGRLVIRVNDASKITPENDVVLEPGDSIFIPPMAATVFVTGAVYNPNMFLSSKELSTVNHYVALAGGYAPRANQGEVLVIKADGSTIRPDSTKIEPGDTIYVPYDLQGFDPWRVLLDSSQLVYNLAFAAGVISKVL
ncbi:hypothetical protein EB093_01690 [bacterium]|nr:hypothetical protein [bacterium]